MASTETISYIVGCVIVGGLILVAGHFLGLDFIAVVLVGMFVGRKLGWWFSRTALYNSPLVLTIVLCVCWRALIGIDLDKLFRVFDLSLIARIFAYGAGAYVSIPNYGLITEATFSASDRGRSFSFNWPHWERSARPVCCSHSIDDVSTLWGRRCNSAGPKPAAPDPRRAASERSERGRRPYY